jgi:hypothetical protein
MSTIDSVQFELGQPGAPAIGVVGGFVVTVKVTLPFLTADAGIASDPLTDTGAGCCPGGLCWPDGLVQTAVGLAVAAKLTSTSPAPKPASAPLAVSVRPLSVKLGELLGGFKCTLLAYAGAPSNMINITVETPQFILTIDMGSSL